MDYRDLHGERGYKSSRKGNGLQGFTESLRNKFHKMGLQVLHRLSTAQLVGALRGLWRRGGGRTFTETE